MFTMANMTIRGVAAAATLALMASAASAQVIDLDGKTVTVVHNASPGGATGLGAQIAADAWAKTMAGNPTMVVQSVAGGALAKGINHVMSARPDGLTVGWVAWQGSTRILDPEPLQIPFQDFGLIGGVGGANFFLHASTAIGDGIKTREDFAEIDSMTFGGFSAKSGPSMQTAAALDLLGIEWSFASGFAGDGPLSAALARGELDGYPATGVVYNNQLRDGSIAEGKSLGVFHFGLLDDDGNMVADPVLAEIPIFPDYYEAIKGEAPSGELWDMINFHANVSAPVNWLVVAPPGTPDEHLAMLRETFVEAMTSPEFLENAERVFGGPPNVVFADEVTDIVNEVQNTPEDMREKLRAMIDRMDG